jgi:hypothetical protein
MREFFALEGAQAKGLVEARLGRQPQDMLEAAVVLEAWAGIPAAGALDAGHRITQSKDAERLPSAGILPARSRQKGLFLEAIGFIVAMIAIAVWAAPLSDDLGVHVIENALLIALPLTVALQWGLNSRYLSRPRGAVILGRHPWVIPLGAGALVGTATIAFGQSGLVATLLSLTWTGGTILIASHLSDGYAGLVLLASTAMFAGLPSVGVLAATAGATTLAVLFAVTIAVGKDEPTHRPGRWGRVGTATMIGLGIGALLVVDRSIDWTIGSVPALGLLPSTIASYWGGSYLWRFHYALPHAVSGVPVSGGSVRGLGRKPLGLLAGAIGRMVLLTTALSLLLVFGAQLFGVDMRGASVLVGFGLVALGTLLVSMLEAIGHGSWVLLALAAAVPVEVVVSRWDGATAAGLGLIAGSAVVVAASLPVIAFVLSRPATTLATRLWVT